MIFGGKTYYMRGASKRTKDGAPKQSWVCTANKCTASITMVDGEIVRSSAHKCQETPPTRTNIDLLRFKVRAFKI